MPEPIIDPITIIVASSWPRPRARWAPSWFDFVSAAPDVICCIAYRSASRIDYHFQPVFRHSMSGRVRRLFHSDGFSLDSADAADFRFRFGAALLVFFAARGRRLRFAAVVGFEAAAAAALRFFNAFVTAVTMTGTAAATTAAVIFAT